MVFPIKFRFFNRKNHNFPIKNGKNQKIDLFLGARRLPQASGGLRGAAAELGRKEGQPMGHGLRTKTTLYNVLNAFTTLF